MMNQVGKTDSFQLFQNNRRRNQEAFADSFNRILSESSNTHNSGAQNQLIGGGLLSGGSRGGQGNLLEMLTPNAVSNMTDSPIFSAGFGGRMGRKGCIRPDGSPQHFG